MIALSIAAVGGCSNTDESPQDVGPLEELDSDPLGSYAGRTKREWSVIASASAVLANECLETVGYPPQAIPPISDDDAAAEAAFVLTPERAAEFGYGLTPDELEGGDDVPLTGGVPRDAMWGGPEAIKGIPVNGCGGAANDALWRDDFERYDQLRLLLEEVGNNAALALRTHPVAVAARAAWSECFEKRGYSFPTTSEAAEAGTLLSPDAQIPMAVADAECRVSSGLDDALRKVNWNVKAGLLEEYVGVVEEFDQIWRDVVDRATAVR